MICSICKKETPCCDCDYAWLESQAKLYANHQRWREQTRKEQAEQMERISSSGGGQLAGKDRKNRNGLVPNLLNRATSSPRKVRIA